MVYNYILYFEDEVTEQYVTLRNNEYDIVRCDKLPLRESPEYINKFFMLKGFDPTEYGLRKFKEKFIQWCKELKTFDSFSIYYTKYFNHYCAVELTFKRFCKGKYEHHERISDIENRYIEMCHNGALSYCDPHTLKCYGYDFSGYYGENLVNIMIPTKRGKEIKLDKLPLKKKDLKYGYYRCDIICDDKNFEKVFNYSKKKTYTNTTINFLRRLIKKYGFNIKIKIIEDGKPNAYVYDDEDMVKGDTIFGKWYKITSGMKKEYPKNKLIKHLQSSLWGHICKYKKKNINIKDIEKENLWEQMGGYYGDSKYKIKNIVKKNNGEEYYTIIERNDPYEYSLARLKPFLAAHGRNRTALAALHSIDEVVRIYNDNVTFNKEQDLKINNLHEEDKTTGYINWIHPLKYEKITEEDERLNHILYFSQIS